MTTCRCERFAWPTDLHNELMPGETKSLDVLSDVPCQSFCRLHASNYPSLLHHGHLDVDHHKSAQTTAGRIKTTLDITIAHLCARDGVIHLALQPLVKQRRNDAGDSGRLEHEFLRWRSAEAGSHAVDALHDRQL